MEAKLFSGRIHMQRPVGCSNDRVPPFQDGHQRKFVGTVIMPAR